MPGFLPNVVTEASSGVMLELAVAASLLTLLWMSAQAKAPPAHAAPDKFGAAAAPDQPGPVAGRLRCCFICRSCC